MRRNINKTTDKHLGLRNTALISLYQPPVSIAVPEKLPGKSRDETKTKKRFWEEDLFFVSLK